MLELSRSLARKEPRGPLFMVNMLSLDSYDFFMTYLRNTETIVRIGGAPTKLDLAGVTDQGKAREPMSNVPPRGRKPQSGRGAGARRATRASPP